MTYHSILRTVAAVALVAGFGGCDRSSPPTHSTPDAGQQAPVDEKKAKLNESSQNRSVPMNQMMASARAREGGHASSRPSMTMPPGHGGMGATLPAGHPPIGTMPSGEMAESGKLPAGHPPIGSAPAMGLEPQRPEKMLALKPPADWIVKKARPLTVAVYDLPRPQESGEDAELTVSQYPGMKNIPVDRQISRWAAQFEQADGAPNVSKTPLDGAAHPTTVADIKGTYSGGGMMMGASSGAAQKDYEMLVAVVETDQGPWFFKLLGPQATVAAHRDEFLQFVRDAK